MINIQLTCEAIFILKYFEWLLAIVKNRIWKCISTFEVYMSINTYWCKRYLMPIGIYQKSSVPEKNRTDLQRVLFPKWLTISNNILIQVTLIKKLGKPLWNNWAILLKGNNNSTILGLPGICFIIEKLFLWNLLNDSVLGYWA